MINNNYLNETIPDNTDYSDILKECYDLCAKYVTTEESKNIFFEKLNSIQTPTASFEEHNKAINLSLDDVFKTEDHENYVPSFNSNYTAKGGTTITQDNAYNAFVNAIKTLSFGELDERHSVATSYALTALSLFPNDIRFKTLAQILNKD